MSSEELKNEIERLTKRLDTIENDLEGRSATSLTTPTVKSAVNSRAKPDIFADGSWDEWVAHFKLCADVNKWDDEQSSQQFAVSLRGRAQRIFLTLKEEEKSNFTNLITAMEKKMKPQQERIIHKMTFRQRRREKGESLVDLATDLRQMAARAYPGKDTSFVEDEILDQFIAALENREVRIAVSQSSPTSLEEALSTALRLESLHKVERQERQQKAQEVNMAANVDLQKPTADVNTVGDDIKPPAWAERYFRRQEQFMERLVEATSSNNRKPRNKRDVRCYNCGGMGHYQRDCTRNTNDNRNMYNSGNASRAGLPRM